jgi:hypothetical protein
MTVQLAVELLADVPGAVETEFEIITERDIIVIPIRACALQCGIEVPVLTQCADVVESP